MANCFWFYSILVGWSTWQWVFLNFSKKFWSFDNHDTHGCASAVIWNHLKQIWAIPPTVMKTGFSLCSIFNRENPVLINWEPCNEYRFFPLWKYYTGKPLFWPCTGPLWDCSVHRIWPKYLCLLTFFCTSPKIANHFYITCSTEQGIVSSTF